MSCVWQKLSNEMAKIAKKLTDLVGNTPLMELSGYCGKYGLEQNIIAKLEAFNPAGSVKDRCRTGNGRYHQRISLDIDNAWDDESGTA